MKNAATKETTTFILFKDYVTVAASVSVEDADRFLSRISAAYDMGEPVWMVAEEIRIRASAPPRAKTPRGLAVRVVRVSEYRT